MKGTNATPNPFQKTNTDSPHRSNSLEPESSFFLRRRKTNKTSGNIDNSPTVSPPSGPSKAWPKVKSASSNRSNLDINTGSVRSSLSIGSKFPLNVSDWNEKVARETRSTSDQQRHVTDPPRPPKEGFEWVWFPEGYWAEREWLELAPKKQKNRKWFNKSPERQSSASSNSKTISKGPSSIEPPHIKIGSMESQGSSSRESQAVEDRESDTESPNRKLVRGLQFISPTHPHFTSPSGEPEGLYCKAKRGIEGRFMQRQKLLLDDASRASSICLPSRTTLLLEGTSSYFDRQQRERNHPNRMHLLQANPQTPASPDSSPRRGFGLAPWHRRNSQESFLSASSSVHRLLMGRTPAATPSPEKQYVDHRGIKHNRVEISDAGEPTFLPSEAKRINTPPMSEDTLMDQPPRGFFFDLNAPEDDLSFEQEANSTSTSAEPSMSRSRFRDCGGSLERWESYSTAEPTLGKTVDKNLRSQFEQSLPEHLPNSPLCPMNPKHSSGGLGICVYHGRRRTVDRTGAETGDSAGSVSVFEIV